MFAAAYSLVCRGVMDAIAAARERSRSRDPFDGDGEPAAAQVREALPQACPESLTQAQRAKCHMSSRCLGSQLSAH